MRSIMGKFCFSPTGVAEAAPYCGGPLPAPTPGEREQVNHIRDGDQPHQQAVGILKAMDPNTPMRNLEEFAGLLAAIVVVCPERVDTKHDGTTLRRVLLHACTPERFQWYMNNIRYRSVVPKAVDAYMATGTIRNEQLHARLNSHFRTAVHISKRMLSAEVNTWILADMMVFARALTTKRSRGVKRADLGPYVFSTAKAFSKVSWGAFCEVQHAGWERGGKRDKRGPSKRRGPTAVQVDIYDVIRAKTAKRPRASVYQGVRSG